MGDLNTTAAELLSATQRELTATERAIRVHPFLKLLDDEKILKGRLRDLACEQHSIVSSDRRSFAHLAARYPTGLAGEFFLDMAVGEGAALEALTGFADWLELAHDDVVHYEPRAQAQSYPAFVAWMALNGSRADVALAFLANLAAWGENCAHVAEALRTRYGAPDHAVRFFDFFATPPPGFQDRALAVVDEGLADRESGPKAQRAARLLQSYELAFWDSLMEGIE